MVSVLPYVWGNSPQQRPPRTLFHRDSPPLADARAETFWVCVEGKWLCLQRGSNPWPFNRQPAKLPVAPQVLLFFLFLTFLVVFVFFPVFCFCFLFFFVRFLFSFSVFVFRFLFSFFVFFLFVFVWSWRRCGWLCWVFAGGCSRPRWQIEHVSMGKKPQKSAPGAADQMEKKD